LIPRSASTYTFEHALNARHRLNRNRIETEGGRLLSQMQALQRRRPTAIVLISHSLGGIVLKHALNMAHQRGRLSDLGVNSVILFSCPNFKLGSTTGRNSLISITKEYAKFELSTAGADALLPELINDATEFSKAVESIPICSVYEEKSTSVKEGRPSIVSPIATLSRAQIERLTSHQFVDKDTAALDIPSSVTLGTSAEHNTTCRVHPRGLLWPGLQAFLEPPLRGLHGLSSVPSQHHPRLSIGRQARAETASISQSRSTSTASHARTSVLDTGTQHHPAATAEVRDQEPKLCIPFHYIPHEKNETFHGRNEELSLINGYMCDAARANTFRSFAVTGKGGMGKSQIVNEFAYTHKAQFPVILWIPADDEVKMEQAYSAIATGLGFVREGSVQARDKMNATQLVLNWLAKPSRTMSQREREQSSLIDWLVVFDNVENPDLLRHFWPHVESGAVIVTSRNDIVNSRFYAVKMGLTLMPFGHAESVDLLIQLSGQTVAKTEQQHVEEVAAILHGLPLAIYQMAGVIRKECMGFDEFIEQYRDERKRGPLLNTPQIGLHSHEYKDTLASVWKFEKLVNTRDLIDVLAFLEPDSIPELIFSNLATVQTEFEILPAGYGYNQARSQLLSMSLVSRDIQNRKLSIHRLVQEAARSMMTDDRYSAVLISALELMHAVWPQKDDPAFRNEIDTWAIQETLFTHLILLGKLAGESKWCPPTEGTPQRLQAIDVLLEAAWYAAMRFVEKMLS
jgi:hypothetical protein